MLFAQTNVAVATCHASRCVTVNGGDLFYEEIIREFFSHGAATLGEAVCNAKREVISENPANDWLYGPAVLQTILGDPALRIVTPVAVQGEAPRKSQTQRISIDPNPFCGQTTLFLEGEDDRRYDAELFDVAGRLIASYAIMHNQRNTIGKELLPGAYFVRARSRRSGDRICELKRIIKIN
jgi:hypothetical protein